MSKRGSTKAPVRAPTGRSVGSRELNRRAQAAKRQAVRKQERRARTGPKPSVRLKQALRRIPRAAWICALVACLNAAAWSIITPPFQVPDEPSHFAYTQLLAENDRLPSSGLANFSPDEQTALIDLNQLDITAWPGVHTISTSKEQRILQRDLNKGLSRRGGGGAGGAANGPPLYYMLEMIPYALGSPGTLLDQLELMRLLSALMGGLTALFVFLFVRETLPAVPWAWTVGGLAVALMPILGYMSGALNPDAMLFTVSAASFYCLARAFRRGLTPWLAAAIGGLIAVGLLTKLNFIGLAPGVVLGLVVLSVRAARIHGRAAFLWLAVALGIAASPIYVYALGNLLSHRPLLGVVSTTLGFGGQGRSIFAEISYIWQFYLPRLPGMTNYFPGLSTARELWFNKSVGFYGWLDTSFPLWVDNLALIPAGLLSLLSIRALLTGRTALREHALEIVVYAAMAVGLMILIAGSSYFNNDNERLGFIEPRYLAPLLPLVGVALALAARGAGRRWGPAVGAVIVVLFLAHDLFSQLLVVARFYV